MRTEVMLCLADRRDTAGRKQKGRQQRSSSNHRTAWRKYVHILSVCVTVKEQHVIYPVRYVEEIKLRGL